MTKKLLANFLCGLFILLYLYIAWSKKLAYEVTAVQLSAVPYIGSCAGVISCALPFAAMAVVIGLLIPYSRLLASYVSLVLLLVFTVCIVLLPASDKYMLYSYSGISNWLGWEEHLMLDIVIIGLNIWSVSLERRRKRFNDLMRKSG